MGAIIGLHQRFEDAEASDRRDRNQFINDLTAQSGVSLTQVSEDVQQPQEQKTPVKTLTRAEKLGLVPPVVRPASKIPQEMAEMTEARQGQLAKAAKAQAIGQGVQAFVNLAQMAKKKGPTSVSDANARGAMEFIDRMMVEDKRYQEQLEKHFSELLREEVETANRENALIMQENQLAIMEQQNQNAMALQDNKLKMESQLRDEENVRKIKREEAIERIRKQTWDKRRAAFDAARKGTGGKDSATVDFDLLEQFGLDMMGEMLTGEDAGLHFDPSTGNPVSTEARMYQFAKDPKSTMNDLGRKYIKDKAKKELMENNNTMRERLIADATGEAPLSPDELFKMAQDLALNAKMLGMSDEEVAQMAQMIEEERTTMRVEADKAKVQQAAIEAAKKERLKRSQESFDAQNKANWSKARSYNPVTGQPYNR